MSLEAFSMKQKIAAAVAVLLVVLAVAGSTVLPVQTWVMELATRLQAHGVAGAVLFGLIYIIGAMALVPASAFSLAAGLIYGFSGMALAWLAMMAVAATSFPLARRLLSARVDGFVQKRRLLGIVTEVINEEGWRMVLLVRVSGIVPFGLQNYIFGVTRIAFGPYLLATSVGVLPSILLYAGVGALANAAAAFSGGHLRIALLAVAVMAGIAVITITARKVRARLGQRGA